MKVLSLKQPFAALIVEKAYEDNSHQPVKPIENRAWPLPSTFSVPQRIYVHASLGFYNIEIEEIFDLLTATQWLRLKARLRSIYSAWACYKKDPAFRQRLGYFGCLIGEVTVTGQVTESDDPWFCGPYGYTLVDPVRYDKPIPMRGHLRFFDVPGGGK